MPVLLINFLFHEDKKQTNKKEKNRSFRIWSPTLPRELNSTSSNLPPGPSTFPIIGNLLWLRKSFSELEYVVKTLHEKHGPIVSLPFGFNPAIFVASNSLAYQALVQNGAVFADRPPLPITSKIMASSQCTISSAPYGPAWRLLRRNLTSEILHPSRVRLYSRARNGEALPLRHVLLAGSHVLRRRPWGSQDQRDSRHGESSPSELSQL
ncbi:unnamed protein product, partial [Vitis vinifera]